MEAHSMFELTKSQKQIQKAAKGFAKGEFDKDLAYEFEKSNTFPAKIWKQAAQLGFVGIHFPEKYAGGDMGMLEAVLILEEFCRKDASIGNALAVASFASECLLTFGSDALKKKFLPPVAESEHLESHCDQFFIINAEKMVHGAVLFKCNTSV